MGDRGNIVIRDTDGDVFLYTHWGGSEIADVVRTALAKRWRWDDPSYLARIVFDVLTEGAHGEETGYGISATPQDNEHDYIVLDVPAKKVKFYGGFKPLKGKPKVEYTFEEFVAGALAPEEEDDGDAGA